MVMLPPVGGTVRLAELLLVEEHRVPVTTDCDDVMLSVMESMSL